MHWGCVPPLMIGVDHHVISERPRGAARQWTGSARTGGGCAARQKRVVVDQVLNDKGVRVVRHPYSATLRGRGNAGCGIPRDDVVSDGGRAGGIHRDSATVTRRPGVIHDYVPDDLCLASAANGDSASISARTARLGVVLNRVSLNTRGGEFYGDSAARSAGRIVLNNVIGDSGRG